MPREYPEQTYYPGAWVRLVVRLDEFGDKRRLADAPKRIVKNLNGVKDDRGPLEPAPDPDRPGRRILVPRGQTKAPLPTDQSRSGDDLTFDVVAIPHEMSIQRNGIRTGDKLTATLRFIDCPIDPRVVRSAAVVAVLGCVDGGDFARGIRGQGPRSFGTPLNMVPEAFTGPNGEERSNVRFLGWVDEWECEWSDGQEPAVRLTCQDNVRQLIDIERPPNLVLDMNKRLDEAVALYLSHFNALQGMGVLYLPTPNRNVPNSFPPILADALAHTAFRPNLGPPPAKGGGGKQSVWDYLTDVCGSVAHAIYVDGADVVIQRPRALVSSTTVRRDGDPFQGRTLPGGRSVSYRQMIYGKNVESMKVKRKYSQQAPQNVEVRTYSTAQKKTLVARFPLPEDRVKFAIPGGAQPDQKWAVFRVSGIEDHKVLRAVAQTYYESLGRNELQVDVRTRNLASFGGGNADPDLLDLQAGDTFELLVDRSTDEASTFTRIEKALTAMEKNAAFMRGLGFSDDFARAYAKAYTDAGFLSTFKVRQATFDWSVDDGVQVSLTAVNYIEARGDKLLPDGEEPERVVPGQTQHGNPRGIEP